MKKLALLFVFISGTVFAQDLEKPKSELILEIIKVENKFGYANQDGDIVISPQFNCTRGFHEGLAASKIDVDSKWGYIGQDGNFVIQEQFEDARHFSEGYAPVKSKDANDETKWGYIDKEGKEVIKPQFDDVSLFTEGLAVVSIGDDRFYINKEGYRVENPYEQD